MSEDENRSSEDSTTEERQEHPQRTEVSLSIPILPLRQSIFILGAAQSLFANILVRTNALFYAAGDALRTAPEDGLNLGELNPFQLAVLRNILLQIRRINTLRERLSRRTQHRVILNATIAAFCSQYSLHPRLIIRNAVPQEMGYPSTSSEVTGKLETVTILDDSDLSSTTESSERIETEGAILLRTSDIVSSTIHSIQNVIQFPTENFSRSSFTETDSRNEICLKVYDQENENTDEADVIGSTSDSEKNKNIRCNSNEDQ